MMKKRNIAVAMAAVTVASTVAPAFATGTEVAKENKYTVSKENRDKLLFDLSKLLKKEYTDIKGKVYTIKVSYKTDGKLVTNKQINTSTDLEDLEKIMEDTRNSDIVLNITDNGHVENGNDILGSSIVTYKDNNSLADLKDDLSKIKNGILSVEHNLNDAEVSLKLGKNLGENKIFNSVSKGFTIDTDDSEIDYTEEVLNVDLVDGNKNSIGNLLDKIDELNESIKEALEQVEPCNYGFYEGLNVAVIEKDMAKELVENLDSIVNTDFNKIGLNNEQIKIIDSLLEGSEGLKALVEKAVEEIKKPENQPVKVDPDLPVIEENREKLAANNLDTTKDLYKILDKISNLLKKSLVERNEDAETNLDVLNFITLTQGLDKIEDLSRKGARRLDKTYYEVSLSDSQIDTVKSEKLFDGLMLTEEGKELVDALENGIEIDGKLFEVKQNGEYSIEKISKDNYELVMNFLGTHEINTRTAEVETFKFQVKVTGKTFAELEEIADIFTLTNGKVAGASVNSIVGSRRTETAVQISKENFKSFEKDGNVVLVGANAVVDGLAAGPLAKKLNAPVLLTNADSLDTNVENEIKRLLVDNTTVGNLKTQTVYIVGGEAVVSENVVDQLEKLGLKVERLAGDRRDTTSLAVAEKMVEEKAKFDQAFVVGATGEADAMSIAAHAAKEEAPIIVTALDGTLSKEAKKLIDKKQIDIIGGETVVSKELELELKDIDKDNKVVRVKGDNRAETNANVIRKYYSGSKQVYVAKDGKVEGNDKLVDALAISPVAANNNGVVVLATNDLTEAQQEALELRASTAEKMTQVGGGVAETVITKVAKLLSFIK